ncbi:MAG: NAD(P)/FAD-dependent oxidoreductase [Candidatus Theseobacter exili]|nr:NAD(P)/FAD-dependent oxidoreductase [Candidatus Theseobacter exili]
MVKKTAIIFGAGPAGLTAAYELCKNTDIKPIIFEMTGDIGGISKTVNYKGNRIDIGGHRFFSKSDRVMEWWKNILPLQGMPDQTGNIAFGPDPSKTDNVMLFRKRISRILFLRKLFDYPLSMNLYTVRNLGILRLVKIIFSYLKVRIFPLKTEKSLEDFFVNRFGRELFNTFFKDYTEKVWGLPCNKLMADWGGQRVKGLSISKAIADIFGKIFFRKDSSLSQKNIETSLIEQFMYPKLGPGQLWEAVAEIIKENGGELHLHHKITGIEHSDKHVDRVKITDESLNKTFSVQADYFFSSMPVSELIEAMGESVPNEVRQVAKGLLYRDFITAGFLIKKFSIKPNKQSDSIVNNIPDNWLYIQERDVKLGRIQVFNNWSPFLVKDQNLIWIGLEYFCNEGDELWNKPDEDFLNFASAELIKIDFVEKEDILDGVVLRVPKTYPVYAGSYSRFDVIRKYTDLFENMFLVGRNGMHRYNNADHSMLTAITAVENIINGSKSKENIWEVNTEKDYHEEKNAPKMT